MDQGAQVKPVSTPLTDRTLTATLRKGIEKYPDVPALRDKNTELTYAQTWERARRFAGGYQSLGIERQERVLLMLDNHIDTILSWIGLTFRGAVEVPVNTAYRGAILSHLIKDSGARVAVIEEKYLERFLESAGGMIEKVVVRPGSGLSNADVSYPAHASANRPLISGFDQLANSRPFGPEPVGPWDLLAVLYTSGTTGNSKGVVIPHAALHGAAEHAGNVSAGDVRFVVVPLFHYAGQCGSVYRALIAGATAYIAESFSASRFWDEARAVQATSTLLMSTMPDFLLRQEPSAKDTEHSMREVFMVPVLKNVDEFRRRFNIERIVTAYGSTESQGPLCDNEGTAATTGRVGKPWDLMEFRLVDENDIEVPAGQVGEGVVRSRQPWLLSPGYVGLPEGSLQMWRNGWLHTGDAFYRDQGGVYYFVDRLVDHIRRRGENISSAEVEREVNSHPDVAESAAVAVPSEFTEDEIKIVVLRHEGADLTEEQLARYLIDRMPYFMVPRYVEFVTEFPRTPTLKIRKNVLRAAGTAGAWDREAAGIKVAR